MNIKQSLLVAAAGVMLTLGLAGSASADTWQDRHPRRVEVNHRLANQDYRIHHDLREGRITVAESHRLHREDHFIRHQERFDARFNHGHLTRAEQRALNQDENGVSRQIHNEAH